MSKRADWMAWGLHLVLGLLAGGLMGGLAYPRRRSRDHFWLSEDLRLPFLIGAALLGAGLASLLGDELWLSGRYKVIPPNGVKHSQKSKICSYVCIAFGLCLMAFSIITQLTRVF